jgi:hypothetical protein
MLTSLAAVISATAPAWADRAPAPPPPAARTATPAPVPAFPGIDAQAVPPKCQSFVAQAQASNAVVAVPARISLASCMADQAVAPIALCDCGQSIEDIDQAIEPAVKVLDGVIEVGSPTSQALAQHAKGEMYTGFVMRMTATVPKLGPNATPEEMSLHDMRAQALAPQLEPWRDTARAAFTQVIELAKAHPEIARNASVAIALRDSQQRAADIVTREPAAPGTANPSSL